MLLTEGQRLALDQLKDVALESGGALEVLSGESQAGNAYLVVPISIETRRYVEPGGMRLRDRERFVLHLPSGFPFARPSLLFAHSRFRGEPHVQWGRYICLYQAGRAEWIPSDGIFGFLARVDEWLAAAGAGRLDPEDAPLHPPVAYVGASTKIVAKVDAPPMPTGGIWLGRADLREAGPDRLDLVGWTALDDWNRDPGRATIDAMAILLSRRLPMEYPTKVNDLIEALGNAGVAFELLVPLFRLAALSAPAGRPALMVLGAPMRRKGAGEPLKQHLTVWELPADQVSTLRAYALEGGADHISAVARWMVAANVG